ncbi:MAG: hypothetical protein ACYTGQ_02915 [Planctomycetota bacterium]
MDNPAKLSVTATPALTDALREQEIIGELALAQDASVELELRSLSVPTNGNLAGLAAQVGVTGSSDIVLQGDEDLGRVTLSGLTASVDTPGLSESLNLALDADLNVGGRDGAIKANGQIAGLYNAAGDLDTANMRPNVNATITNLPLGLVDQLAGLDGLAVAALGDRVEQLDVQAVGGAGGKGAEINLAMRTPGLTVQRLSLSLDDSLKLMEPVTIPYTITPELLAKLAGPDAGVSLAKPVGAELTISQLAAQMPGETGFDPTQTAVTASLALADTTVLLAGEEGESQSLSLGKSTLNIDADSLSQTKVDLQTTAKIDEKSVGADMGVTGDVALALNADTGLNADGKLKPIAATVSVKADGLDSDLKLAIDEALKTVAIEAGSTLSVRLDTPRLRAWGALQDEGPALAEPATLSVTLDRTEAPMVGFNLKQIKTGATATLADLELTGDPKLEGTELNDTRAKLMFDGSTGAATVQMNSVLRGAGQTTTSPLTVDASLANLLDPEGAVRVDSADIAATVALAKLPSGLVDSLAGGGTNLPIIAGPELNLDAKLRVAGGLDADGRVDLRLASERLQANTALKLGEALQQETPTKVQLDLTPESYAALIRPAEDDEKEAPKLTLREPVRVEVTLNELSGPGSALTDPQELGFNATILASPIKIHNAKTDRVSVLTNAKLDAISSKLGDALNVKLHGDVGLANTDLGSLDVVADLTRPMATDPQDRIVKFTTDLKSVSVPAVDTILNQDGLLVALLGDAMDLSVAADLKQMAGPVTLTLDATHADVELPLVLGDGFATLQKDAPAELRVQEELGQRFLSHPLLKQAVRSETPITVQIAKQGFRVPVQDFDIAKAHIERITVDPGKLIIRNAGLVRTLTQLPQTIGKVTQGNLEDLRAREGRDEMTAWFTPVDISVIDGKITYSRMDMLLGDDYQVATWGEMDLVEDYGDMVLGLAERAMRRVYGIRLYEDEPDYVDQFPMIGPLATLGPDMKDLQGRMVLLTAGGVGAKAGGSSGEKIVSGILGVLTTVDQATNKKRKLIKPAPPARKPFPWPEETPEQAAAPTPQDPNAQAPAQPAAEDKKEELSKEEKLSRDIETGVKLLEGLFKKK